ncbi:MAG: nucleoside triphosphate pyrophosphohydrolase [Candidatus Pacearchaeota archaeon]
MKKLVRDNIPEIIKNKGEKPKFYQASQKEYEKELYKKLIEEVKEFNENHSKEEFADILEVLDAIGKFKSFNKKEIIKIKDKKAKSKGKFDKRIILEIS